MLYPTFQLFHPHNWIAVYRSEIGCDLEPVPTAETGMFKVSILYPNGKGKTFDMNYYERTHMPLVAGLSGKSLKFYEFDKGVASRTPNDEVPFVAIGYFYCYDVY